ncbi:nicotinamide riboside transporter PnuC [Thermoactinospora rubra]|uniref:nicotinamide riboside transporter PnuC n=1 Tax=Thermoactinospora rubra TaxID=1088767 RepID=UPI000A10F26A|nr:nicotinamide riboside transporter PnuC [Thermoactinospora rubra]
MNWAEAGFQLLGLHVLWTDFVGSIAALIPVLLAMRKSIWNWPIQFAAAVLLIMAYATIPAAGSILKNAMMALLAVYGFWKWQRGIREEGELVIRQGTARERLGMLAAIVLGTAAFWVFFYLTGWSWGEHAQPPEKYFLIAADAYIFVGGAVATWAMSRALVEFWIIWILVDLVGVPVAFRGGIYFNGSVYVVFFVLAVIGFVNWLKQSRRPAVAHA